MLTRYVLPAVLIAGFLSLVAWAARNIVFPPRPVTVVPVLATQAAVQREGTPLFKAAGWIEPRPTPVRVAALAPGVVEQLLVVEDQQVKAGQPIAELVKQDAKLLHDAAQADLKLRQAELKEAQATLAAAKTRYEQPVHLQAVLGEAEALLAKIETQCNNLPFETRRAEAQRDFARKNYDGKVSSKGVVAGKVIDEAKSELESAKALVEELHRREESLKKERTALAQRRDAIKKQLELLADELRAKDEAEAKVNGASARVEQAQVSVAEAKLRFDRMTVRSPIDGRVYRLVGHPGATLSGGIGKSAGYDSSTVVTLYRPTMLQVRVDVRFEDIPKVSLGQPVRIENPALSSPLTGKVLFVSSEADVQKNTLQVKVEIASPPPVFKPEMLVEVTFVAPREPEDSTATSKKMRLYVPRPLVKQSNGDTFVWVADQSAGVVRRTPVETGVVGTDDLVEINSGLTATSRIVATGSDGLQDGDRIRITAEEPDFAPGTTSRSTTGDSP